MGALQISVIIFGISAVIGMTYVWHDARLRRACIRRLDAWQRQ
jgi:hypothetical protein